VNAEDLARARELLTEASAICVLTGAGISAESGVPTFRGPGGLWRSHRPENLATPEAFASDPRLVWEWYGWRRDLVNECEPNPAHRALARAALDGPPTVLVTQNVDGLQGVAAHQEAGERNIGAAWPLELHGSLFQVKCTACDYEAEHRQVIDAGDRSTLPHCPECGALLRPGVVWFGEVLDSGVLTRAFRAAEAADLCLVVGTSALVHPAASVPLATLRSGGAVVEVNPEPTPLSSVAAVTLRGPAGRVLPALLGP
jgi:NAD-dependent deacetylase